MIETQESVFEKFRKKFFDYKDTQEYYQDIINEYTSLLDIISKDYSNYRKYLPHFISILEENDFYTIAHSINVLLPMLKHILKSNNIPALDISVLNSKFTKKTSKNFLQLFKKTIIKGKKIRISDFECDIKNYTEQDIREMISLLIHDIQKACEKTIISKQEFEDLILLFPFLRFFLKSINEFELFYYPCGTFLQRLHTSDYNQTARDFSEEILLSAYEDNLPMLGFLNSFVCYSIQTNIHLTLVYANLSLFVAIKEKKGISNKFVFGIIKHIMIFCRNNKLYDYAIYIHKLLPQQLELSSFDKRALDHVYYLCLLFKRDVHLPSKILNYLNKERENIFQSGINDVFPWLVTLLNIKQYYPFADFSNVGLGYYLQIFEQIVPKEQIIKYKSVIRGDSPDNKDHLIRVLKKLKQTRYLKDIAYDNSFALTIANKLIEYSFSKKDTEAILLAMMIKSDFSLNFKSKTSETVAPFILPNDEIEEIDRIYNNEEKLIKQLSSSVNEVIIWLSHTEGKLFQLSLAQEHFYFTKLNDWIWSDFQELIQSDFFSKLSFNDVIKDKFGFRPMSKHEYIEQTRAISEQIKFCKLQLDLNESSLYVVKDMVLAHYPHNLYLDKNNRFLHLSSPITNILSTEWYLSNKEDKFLNSNFTKSIWIPIEQEDITLNLLYHKLETVLESFKFKIVKDSNISTPISSDLNIICSHGRNDIASNQAIYPNDNALKDFDNIIGDGKILIMFVCHSGSYHKYLLRNEISSMVKSFISLGYKAVIAPYWALHIDLPSIWLPVFIDSLNNGDSIDISLFKANNAIFSKYPTPSAWATMHLYGNPHIKIENVK